MYMLSGLTAAMAATTFFLAATAGNPDRSGQSGASELLINPWARSAGLHGLNSGSVRGLEAMRLNIGGMAFTRKTEVSFSRTSWLQGADIPINAFGFAQHVGESAVLGLELMSVSFGEQEITTTSQPEGGIGTFKPQFINLALGYSRAFSNSIYAGFAVRGISEAIADVRAMGIALDAGIQYVTGRDENIKFGIALRNVGTPMRFGGDGLSFKGDAQTGDYQMTLQQRSEKFELPSLLNIGGAYDIRFRALHRVTLAGNFTSNSFTSDQLGAGIEYAFRERFMLRAGYNMEKDLIEGKERSQVYTGLSAGLTVEMPLKKDGPAAALDYSYRATNPWKGIHSIGVRMDF